MKPLIDLINGNPHVYIIKHKAKVIAIAPNLVTAECYVRDHTGNGTTPAEYSYVPVRWIGAQSV